MFVSFLLGWILCKKKYQLLLKKYKTIPDIIQTTKLVTKTGALDESEAKEKPLMIVLKKEIKNTITSVIFAIIIKSKSIISSIFHLQIKWIKVKKE